MKVAIQICHEFAVMWAQQAMGGDRSGASDHKEAAAREIIEELRKVNATPPAPIASAEEAVPSGSLRLRNMTLEEAARRVENQFGLGTVAADVRSMKFERSSREDLSRADDYGDLPEEAVYLADEEIDIIAESMPGGIDGFLKGWGWRNFARAIEAEVLLTHPAAAQPSREEVLEEAALSDDELALIREEAATITDDWSERQLIEPTRKESDAKFVREILRLTGDTK